MFIATLQALGAMVAIAAIPFFGMLSLTYFINRDN